MSFFDFFKKKSTPKSEPEVVPLTAEELERDLLTVRAELYSSKLEKEDLRQESQKLKRQLDQLQVDYEALKVELTAARAQLAMMPSAGVSMPSAPQAAPPQPSAPAYGAHPYVEHAPYGAPPAYPSSPTPYAAAQEPYLAQPNPYGAPPASPYVASAPPYGAQPGATMPNAPYPPVQPVSTAAVAPQRGWEEEQELPLPVVEMPLPDNLFVENREDDADESPLELPQPIPQYVAPPAPRVEVVQPIPQPAPQKVAPPQSEPVGSLLPADADPDPRLVGADRIARLYKRMGLAVVSRGERTERRFGMANSSLSHLILPIQYRSIERWERTEFFLLVGEDERRGLCRSNGELLLPPIFDRMPRRMNETVPVMRRDPQTLQFSYSFLRITESGAECRNTPFLHLELLKTPHLYIATRGEGADARKGLITLDGETLLEADYELLEPFAKNLYHAVRDGRHGLINARGKVVLPFECLDIAPFVRGRADVILADGKPGWVDARGSLTRMDGASA